MLRCTVVVFAKPQKKRVVPRESCHVSYVLRAFLQLNPPRTGYDRARARSGQNSGTLCGFPPL